MRLKTTAPILITAMFGVTALVWSVSAQQQPKQAKVLQKVEACTDHFVALDANKDDRISVKEDRTVREQIFSALDKNKDDVISHDEYVPCLLSNPAFRGMAQAVGQMRGAVKSQVKLGASKGTSERMGQFEQADADGDRSVSWKEYMNAAKAEYASTGLSYGQSEASAAAGWEFARLDTDRDGQLTSEEWYGHRDLVAVAEAAFKALDGDGDGRISHEEYDALVDKRYEEASQQLAERQEGRNGLSVWNYEYWF